MYLSWLALYYGLYCVEMYWKMIDDCSKRHYIIRLFPTIISRSTSQLCSKGHHARLVLRHKIAEAETRSF